MKILYLAAAGADRPDQGVDSAPHRGQRLGR